MLLSYFRWADQMSDRFRELPADEEALATMYLRTWLGALSALVEGWRTFGLSHPPVDHLLVDGRPRMGAGDELTYEHLLRIAQADVFRFTAAGSPPGIVAFLRVPGAVEWAHDLHLAFREFYGRQGRR